MTPHRSALRRVLAMALLLAGVSAAGAQPYPSRPVHIIVPFPPGGTTDTAARIIGERLSEEWKQPVVIEGKTGAGTTIAAAFVAGAPADGHVLYLTSIITQVTTGILYKNLPYDPLKSFAAVAPVTAAPFVFVAGPSSKVESLKDLVSLARGRPGQLTYATSGTGGAVHLVTELFANATGTTSVHVPYKGMTPALAALLGGQVDFLVADASVMPHVRSGRVRALAVTPPRRSLLMPDVPTLGEAGVPGLEAIAVQGVLAPARTPREVVTRINASLNRAVAAEDVRRRLNSQGMEAAPPASPEEFGAFLVAEFEKYGRIIREARISID